MSHLRARSQSVKNSNFNTDGFLLEHVHSSDLTHEQYTPNILASETIRSWEDNAGPTFGIAQDRKVTNRNDGRFSKSESLIRRELENALARRRIGLKTTELCRNAKIAGSTFYLHYQNCDEALIQYELALEEEFVRIFSQVVKRDLAWMLLLTFISRHRRYFNATFTSRDFYLLTRLLSYVCEAERLATNLKSYVIYVGSVEMVILCWGEHDKFAIEKIERYQQKLMTLKVKDYGI